jgi:hypothetical protein
LRACTSGHSWRWVSLLQWWAGWAGLSWRAGARDITVLSSRSVPTRQIGDAFTLRSQPVYDKMGEGERERKAYLQLLLDGVHAQLAHRHTCLALDGSTRHIPGEDAEDNGDGQQRLIAARQHD